MAYGDKPFGLADVKITNAGGTSQVDLPAAQRLRFGERIQTAELTGDDQLQSTVSRHMGVEWELGAGGISLDAYALLTGRTVAVDGTTPNETSTLAGTGGENFPYVKIYGKVLGEAADDLHCKLPKAKVTAIDGEFTEGQFFVTRCTGIAVPDADGTTFEFVANETAADLPST